MTELHIRVRVIKRATGGAKKGLTMIVFIAFAAFVLLLFVFITYPLWGRSSKDLTIGDVNEELINSLEGKPPRN